MSSQLHWLAYRLQEQVLKIVHRNYSAGMPVMVCNHVDGTAFNMRFAPIDAESVAVKVSSVFNILPNLSKEQITKQIDELKKMRAELAHVGDRELALLQNALSQAETSEGRRNSQM